MGFQHKTYRPCGAACKRTGKPCQNPAIFGSNRCRLHGGKSRKGLLSPRLKHGLNSQSAIIQFAWKEIARAWEKVHYSIAVTAWIQEPPKTKWHYYRWKASMFRTALLFKPPAIPPQYAERLFLAWREQRLYEEIIAIVQVL